MDPISAFGIASGALQTIHIIGNTIRGLWVLHGKYKEAELSIHSLITVLSSIKEALFQLHDWTNRDEHGILNHPDCLRGLEVAVSGCQAAMDVFAEEVIHLVESITPEGQERGHIWGNNPFGFRERIKIVWNDEIMKDHYQRLHSQVLALQLLLQVCQCRTSTEQLELLRRDENQRLIRKVADDTATLRSTRSAANSRAATSTPPASLGGERRSAGTPAPFNVVNPDVRHWVMNQDMQTGEPDGRRFGGQGIPPTSSPLRPSPTRVDEGYYSGAQSPTPPVLSHLGPLHPGQPFATLPGHLSPEDNDVSRSNTTALARASAVAYENLRRSQSAANALPSPSPSPRLSSSSSLRRSGSKLSLVRDVFSRRRHSRRTSSTSLGQSPAPASPIPGDSRPLKRASTTRQKDSTTSIDFFAGSGVTAPPIVKAAQSGAATQVEVQIKSGANIEARHDETARTALAVAAHCGKDDVVTLLLENGADVNTKDAAAMSPLHLASSRGHTNVLCILLEEDVDVDARDQQNRTAFWIAVDSGYIDAAKLLLDYHAKINSRAAGQLSALHRAAMHGDLETVNFLRQHDIDVLAKDAEMKTALHHACEKGHTQVVEKLLSFGANIEARGLHQATPLICAAVMGHPRTTQLLLKKGAAINAIDENGLNALHWAAFNGHLEVVQLLRQKKASVTTTTNLGRSPLHLAAWNKQFPVVEFLLRQKVDLETRCSEGLTPIHYACKAGSLDVAVLLLDAGASAHAHAEEAQRHAIHLAAQSGSVQLCRLLQNKGLPIDDADSAGITPLAVASREGHLDVVRFLLSAGASVVPYNPNNATLLPLCAAAMNGHGMIAELLLSAGASPSEPDGQGWYACTYAAHHGHPTILGSLLPRCSVPAKQHLSHLFLNYGFDALSPIGNKQRGEVSELVSQVTADLAQSGLLQLGPDGVPIPVPQNAILHDRPPPSQTPPPARPPQLQPHSSTRSTTEPEIQCPAIPELSALSIRSSHAEFPSERSPNATGSGDGEGESARESGEDHHVQNSPSIEATQARHQTDLSTRSPSPTEETASPSSSYPPRASSVSPLNLGAYAPPFAPLDAFIPAPFDISVGDFPSHMPSRPGPASEALESEPDLAPSPRDVEDIDRTPKMPSTVSLGPRTGLQSANESSNDHELASNSSDPDSGASFRTADEDHENYGDKISEGGTMN